MHNDQENPETVFDGDAEPEEPAEKVTAGQLLREARETRLLSIQEVAEELHLTRHYIQALEADQYDKLPGEVFARGYTRSYARLLDLDPEHLLELHDRFGERRLARKEEAIKRHARRRMDKNRPWIMVSGVAFIALAVALWFFSGQPEQTGPVPESAVPASGSGGAGDEEDSSLVLPDAPALTADGGISEAAILPESLPGRPRDSRFDVNWSGDDSLIIVALSDSWIEIEGQDASHRFHEQVLDGSVLHLTGDAPFSLLLEDATAVELHFNGRLIDISSNVREDNSARLTLGL